MPSSAKLFLVVSNPEELTHGSKPLFGPVQHNTIISSNTTTGWRLHDATGKVHAPHACVQVIDNCYVMVDLCGHTYINHHCDPLGKMHIVALNDSDTIRIGKYHIKALIDDSHLIDNDKIPATQGVGHLSRVELERLFGSDNALDALLRGMETLPRDDTLPPSTTDAMELNNWLGISALEKPKAENALEQWLHKENDENATARRAFAPSQPTRSWKKR